MSTPLTKTLGDILCACSSVPVSEDEWLQLVRAIGSGDQRALYCVYERTYRIVFTLIVRITMNPETAEEVTLDVFYEVWRRASSYDPANGSVVGWIMNQARSRAIDRLRFDQRKKEQTYIRTACVPQRSLLILNKPACLMSRAAFCGMRSRSSL